MIDQNDRAEMAQFCDKTLISVYSDRPSQPFLTQNIYFLMFRRKILAVNLILSARSRPRFGLQSFTLDLLFFLAHLCPETYLYSQSIFRPSVVYWQQIPYIHPVLHYHNHLWSP
jgi:hypothetical protein